MLSELGFRFLAQRPSPLLLFLPPDPHGPPHFVRNLLLRLQNAIFKPSKNHLVFCFHFFSKKSRKSWILASQNRPKIHSKAMSQKTCDFSSNFARKMLCCNSADIDFVLVFPILFACWALFFESLFECILIPKNLQKTTPKRRPNPLKIDVKNMSFFNIVFFGFRPRFWKVLGLQDGAKLALKATKNFGTAPFLPS